MDTATLKKIARQYGADLVGIAPAERFASLPPERHPCSIAPEAKSIIVLGRRILRGSLRGVEEGTNFGSTYGCFGFTWLENNFLSQTTYDVTCWIETQGFEAIPLFGYHDKGMPKGVPVAADKPAPNVYVDIEFAAMAAGLGEMALGGFFLTPEFGPRQRFAVIVTDAELEPDAVRDKSICADCGACADACPLGAIDVTDTHDVGVPGHTMPVANINYAVCKACPNGATSGPGRGEQPDRLAAACVRACVVRLENAGKCKNQFTNSFRKRTPWAMDVLRRPVDVSSNNDASKLGCDGGTRA